MPDTAFLSIVLHAHLPFVFEPAEQHHLEERWYYEALTECYLPLLSTLERLAAEGVPYRLTISLSPTLLGMLAHPVMARRYDDYLARLIRLAESECHRTARDERFNRLANFYLDRFRFLQAVYQDRYHRNLLPSFARLHEAGHVELITSCATHGYLPLMKTREAVRAQIVGGVRAFTGKLGFAPRGFWLPECGYFTGVEDVLAEQGLGFTFLDSHGLLHASPSPRNDVYAPVRTAAGVAFFARDQETSAQVWSQESGYPGDHDYREYYRDIGFDLEHDYLQKFLPYSVRVNTGLKYYRVTGKGEHKEVYNPDAGLARARQHAANFHFNRTKQLEYLTDKAERPPIVTAMYDAELFGHWWFEGPLFLEELFRLAAANRNAFTLTLPSGYLKEYGAAEEAVLYHSSWGEGGYSKVWLNPSNDWLYPRYHRAESSLAAYNPAGRSDLLSQRLYNQAVRELLLAQGSDWAFMINAGTTAEYARKRVLSHLDNFACLEKMLEGCAVDRELLSAMENRVAGLFPDVEAAPLVRSACDWPVVASSPQVLMLSWEYPPQVMGGLSHHVDDLSQALTQAGQPVSVLTTLGEGSAAFEIRNNVCVYRVAIGKQTGGGDDFYRWVLQLNLAFFNLAMRIVPASRYTLLHAHDWLVAPAALALRQAFQLPLVVTVHATEYGRNAGLHTPLQHRIHAHEQQLVQEADRIICCSRFMAREVARLFAIPEEKVTVIENGVVPENIAAAKLSGADRMNYARDDEELLFFVGRLVKEKGLEVLLAALAKVFPVRNVRAVIAGKGPMFAELERQARGYGIRERIHFAGFMADDERNRLLATADLVVLPSLYEPFGIAVLEAMAAGATVVVSDVGGMSEVVRHGIDGWKVPAGDPAALAAAILMLLDDRKLRHELGRNARDQVVSAYSWSELAGKTKALYRKTWESAETNLAAGRGGQNG